MSKIALITGASRGIGLALSHLHAQAWHDLVLVARNKQKLSSIAEKFQKIYNITVHVIVEDLTDMVSVRNVYSICKDQSLHIDFLVNNAWFWWYGNFVDRSRDDDCAMIDLNIKALTFLTHLFLPDMISSWSWKILQVASTAGMVPWPLQAVYHATKAYVLSLSQAIAKELEWTWVTMTALCPWPVATWFAQTANLEDSAIFQQAVSPDTVAKDGYDAMMKGKLLVISWLPTYYKILLGIMPLLPRSYVLNEAKKAIKK